MKERCSKCGKKARLTCPALDAPLCSRCCGTGRGVSIDCTPDCTSNPFGTSGYTRYLEIDSALTSKIFKAMVLDGYDYPRMLAESKRFMLIHEDDDPMATGSFSVMQDWIFHQEDGEGDSRLQHWMDDGWPDYSNDEQRLLRMRQLTELTFVELLRTEGEHTTWVKDLLDPNAPEYALFDFRLVEQFKPFQVVWAHITAMPHFSKIEANGASINPALSDKLIRFVSERSGASEPSETKAWLRLHSPEVAKEYARLIVESRDRLISGIDLTACTTVYQSDRSAEDWAIFLTEHEEFDEEPDYDEEDTMEALYGPVRCCFQWMRWGGAIESPQISAMKMRVSEDGERVQVLASVYVHPDHVVLTGVDRKMMDWLAKRWSSEIAPGLVVETDGVRDLKTAKASSEISTLLAGRASAMPGDADIPHSEMDDAQGIPPGAAGIMQDFEEEHFRKLIDDPIPALQGKSPREVARSKDPQLKATLEPWAKNFIHGHSKKEAEYGYVPKVFWFYKELGLGHLWPSHWPQD